MNIYTQILNNERAFDEDYGLLSGASGYLLLLYYRKDYDRLYFSIQRILENFEKKTFSPLYSSGLAGLLWVLKTVNSDPNITYLDDVIDTLDFLLVKSYQRIRFSNLDFLHGISGIVHYWAGFDIDEAKRSILKEYVEKLDGQTLKTANGYCLRFYNPVQKKYTVNYSLSHGLSAIIQILSRLYKIGVEQSQCKFLIEGYIEFILNNRNANEESGSVFPNTFEELGTKSRLAWCYGDLGIAISIWQAGDNTRNKQWKREAEQVFIKSTRRITLQDAMAVDPMICHGTSGVAVLYNRMWRNTGIEDFKVARDHWLETTSEFRKYGDDICGYKYFILPEKKWVNNLGLLEGLVGLEISRMQSTASDDIKWDKALLMCS